MFCSVIHEAWLVFGIDKAWVFGRLFAGFAVSNPAADMDFSFL
jgi:hypothetical protein